MILLKSYIGQELRRVRQEKEMSLRDTASAACVSLGYLSEVERGLKEVSSELLHSMCGALELPVSSLLSQVTEKLVLDELEELLDMTSSAEFLEVGTRMDRLTSAQPLSMM
jgi:transcriptional regulator with XRE-family HTH domain